MGWKPGQGIGPRVTWRQREIQYGRGPDRTGPDVDEEAKKHTYPPKDTHLSGGEILRYARTRKGDFHGLEYARALGLHVSLGVRGPGEAQSDQGSLFAGMFFTVGCWLSLLLIRSTFGRWLRTGRAERRG